MKQRAPALSNSPIFQRLWDALGSKLINAAQEHLLYTQEVRGSSPLPPTIEAERSLDCVQSYSRSIVPGRFWAKNTQTHG